MVVIILEKVSASLRGELSRWLIEPKPGVFIGHVSAMVRDKLWEKCCRGARGGDVYKRQINHCHNSLISYRYKQYPHKEPAS